MVQHAGCLEGAEQDRKKAAARRQEFDEDDQTNLYMAAHNLKTQNKKGLGTQSHTGNNPQYFVVLQCGTVYDSYSAACIH